MLKKSDGTITWFEFSSLQSFSFIRHGCFSRKGGVSKAPFDSLNIKFCPEEPLESAQENRSRIQKALGTKSPLISVDQVHGVNIAVIKNAINTTPLGQFDALITNLPKQPLTIMHADCQACLIVDPEHHAIAAIHAGWRGNVQNMYLKVIQKLIQEYASRPESLFACISPSLGPCHSEFKEWKHDFPKEFWPYKKENDCFDLWEIGRKQLSKAGIKEEHIEIAKMCTFDEKEHFFSYRRDGLTGRNASSIMLL